MFVCEHFQRGYCGYSEACWSSRKIFALYSDDKTMCTLRERVTLPPTDQIHDPAQSVLTPVAINEHFKSLHIDLLLRNTPNSASQSTI